LPPALTPPTPIVPKPIQIGDVINLKAIDPQTVSIIETIIQSVIAGVLKQFLTGVIK
jgi:hypothetical protein